MYKTPTGEIIYGPVKPLVPDVAKRVQRLLTDTALLIAGATLATSDAKDCQRHVSREVLCEALLAAASRAHSEACWLSHLPPAVLSMDCPTGDEEYDLERYREEVAAHKKAKAEAEAAQAARQEHEQVAS
jgi:hypothetical protein